MQYEESWSALLDFDMTRDILCFSHKFAILIVSRDHVAEMAYVGNDYPFCDNLIMMAVG